MGRYARLLLWIYISGLSVFCFKKSNAQTFKYKSSEASEILNASDLNTHSLPDSITVWCNDWDFITTNPTSWTNTFKLKSNNTFVKFGINNDYPITAYLGSVNYTYRLTYKIYGFNDPSDTVSGYVSSSDTLTISYSYNSLSNPYQDLHLKKYSNFYKAIIIITGIYDDSAGVISPAVLSNVLKQNFYVEGSIVTQRYDKSEYGTGGTSLETMPFVYGSSNYLKVFWNYISGDTTTVQLTPVNFEFEWTYVDDYSRDVSTGSVSSLPSFALNYDFTHNSTRVWLDSNFYRIPLIYQSGYVIFRVRAVRPDSVRYRYPVYGDWSLPDTGVVSSLSAGTYYATAPYSHDSLNWQYSVNFAEGGKNKQVLSFYDGLLKDRQSISRFNSRPDKLIVTQNIYDFEGRQSIKTLPAPVSTPGFIYQHNVDINSISGLPYQANDFDTGFSLCPGLPPISPLASTALASIYYSNLNPETTSYQKFVPDAEGYPLVQTIFSPGYTSRVDQQGGAGATLQIGNSHSIANYYVGASQYDLNTLFGLNVGLESYYTATVTHDANEQYSMVVKDYEGRQRLSAMIGPGPSTTDHAIVSVDVPPSFVMHEDLLYGRTQIIVDNTRTADFDFFNQANGMDTLQYIYTYNPFPLCPGQALSVKAHYHYDVTDQCGNVVTSQDSVLGVNGIAGSTVSFSGSKDTFYAHVAPYHVHKTLTIDPYDMEAALDSFFDAPPSCFYSEPYFIRNAVESRKFPCPGESTDPCAQKKWEMMQELFPMAKYGKYTTSGAFVIGTSNSIFTQFTPPGSQMIYRYQDSCTVPSLPDSIILDGFTYKHLRTMRTDSFIIIYNMAITRGNYSIAEDLLPLHPEYCQLRACFSDTFKTQVLAIPDYKVGQRLNRLYLDSIVAHDPMVSYMTAHSYSHAIDSLTTYQGGLHRLDSMILLQAYCACSDSVMYKECAKKIFKYEVNHRLISNEIVKEYYFDNLIPLYFNNRERFVSAISAAQGDSCSHCALRRMTLEPQSVFDNSFSAVGTPVLDSISMFSTFSGSSSMGWLSGVAVVADSMDSTMLAIYDSATAEYNFMDSAVCYGQIDTILAHLSNCIQGNSSLLTAVRNTLDSLCAAHAITSGSYTPEQIRFAIVRNGISISDLCNPYVVSYVQFPSVDPPAQVCMEDTVFHGADIFLNDTAILRALGTVSSIHYHPLNYLGNVFEQALASYIGASTAMLVGSYNSGDKEIVLAIIGYNPFPPFGWVPDTVRLYLRSPIFGNMFATTSDSFVVKTKCTNEITLPLKTGFINQLAFVADVTEYATSSYFTASMLGWVDSVEMMHSDMNPLSGCIPCTQMRDLYTQFVDSLQSYGIAGVDHPYCDQMLQSFMNYKLHQLFTTDQYERFIESCALADSMLIPRYVAYSTYTFLDSMHMAAFIDTLNHIDTNYDFSHAYRDRNSPTIRVGVRLNGVPLSELWKYKNKLSTYPGPFASRIVNAPFILLQSPTTIGFLYTSTHYPFSPCDSSIFAPSDSVTCTPSTKWVWYGDHFEKQTYYDLTCPSTLPPYRTQGIVYKLKKYIHDREIPSVVFFPNYQTTIDNDYYKSQKKDYLNYTYQMQGKAPYFVLNQLQTQYLTSLIPSYSTYEASYTGPFNPNIYDNLYLSDPSAANRYFDTLKQILDNVASLNTVSPGYTFFDTNYVNVPVTAPLSLKAYRCADGTYWYRYFGGADTLYNLFLKFPDYVPVYQRKNFYIVSSGVTPALGDSTMRYFYVYLQQSGDTAIIQAKGLATFSIGKNMELDNVLMGNPITGAGTSPSADTFDICERQELNSAITQGIIDYNNYIDSAKGAITAAFREYLTDSVQEQLILSYLNDEFAYTLYTYDRAGNLTATVPPMGVNRLPGANVDSVNLARTANTTPSSATLPAHTKKNTYEYNTINEVVNQATINGGTTTFQYDDAGRLILSQNAKQSAAGDFTYNIYDRQSRVIETGQAHLNDSTMMSLPDADAQRTYMLTLDRRDVVMTVYDTQVVNLYNTAKIDSQQNLRKRVAAVKYFDTLKSTDTYFANYTYITHYSYDIAGNVQTLAHDFPALGAIKQRYKRIDYDYDLISGKVNLLSYNRGFADQYYQRYSYDADNRLTLVETSADGYIWTQDAAYSYYEHGPLARIDLGDLRVQGIDYAYTIQGWLKAMNGDTLNTGLDMGLDGHLPGPINAADAAAYTIDYFDGDYSAISGWHMQHIPNTALSLYNGNIARQTVAIDSFQRLHKQYIYDQMNRLKNADYFAINITHSALDGLNDFKSRYSYDLDGNIKALIRYGNNTGSGASIMDSLTYEYASGTNHNDRLTNVLDSAANTYTNDLGNFTTAGANRYSYDATGNVTADFVNAQDTIEWNLYNKVIHTLNNADTSEMKFVYDGAGHRVAKSYIKNRPGAKTARNDYYVHDAQGNILAIYHENDSFDATGDTIKKRNFSLAEHDIYGSSRLGVKDYYPMQTGALWVYDSSIADTIQLFSRPPWYSNEYQDCIDPTQLSPYYNPATLPGYSQHITGQKQYEITDHLGNVLATVSDLRTGSTFIPYGGGGLISGNPATIMTYKPLVQTAQDYYPFGQLMPGRYKCDTNTRTLTTTLVEMVPIFDTIVYAHDSIDTSTNIHTNYYNTSCMPCGISVWTNPLFSPVYSDYYTSTDYSFVCDMASSYYGGLSFEPAAPFLPSPRIRPGRSFYVSIDVVYINPCNNNPAVFLGWSPDGDSLLSFGFSLHPGINTFPFLYSDDAAKDTILYLNFWSGDTTGGSCSTAIDTITIRSISIYDSIPDTIHIPYTIDTLSTTMNVVSTVSSEDHYHYGYNGKLKDNEWAGVGNHYDYGERLYDPRVARFPIPDPLEKKYPGYSPYLYALNSPIAMVDAKGQHGEIVVHKGNPNSSDPTLSRTTVTATALIYTTYEKQGELRSFYSNPTGPGNISKSQDGWNGTFILPNYDATFNVQFVKPLNNELELNAILQSNPVSNWVESNNQGNGVAADNDGTQGRKMYLQPGRYEGLQGHAISHEIGHIFGLGHLATYYNNKGVATISSYKDPRGVIDRDIQMIIDPAVELASQYSAQDITIHIFAFTDANGKANPNMATYKVYDASKKEYIQSVTINMMDRAREAAKQHKKDEPDQTK